MEDELIRDGGVNLSDLETGHEVTFKELARSTIEAANLLREGGLVPLGATTLVGMKAAFPERFSNEQLRKNPNMKYFSCMTWLGVELNDAVDVIPHAREADRQDAVEAIFRGWKKVIGITKSVSREQENEGWNMQLMRDYQREILFLEKRMRESEE